MHARRRGRFRREQSFATAETFGSDAVEAFGYVVLETFGCEVVAEASDSYAGDLRGHARSLDRELRQLVGEDNTCRHVLGRLGLRFLALRGHERLGFARFGDYCAERLGWSGRQLQEPTRVVAALSHLPMTEQAFRRGTLGWSKARLLASVATALDEVKWIAIASNTDARTLATVTASARAAAREQRRLPANNFDAEREEEERVLVRIECSKRARFLWNEARRLAPQMAGRTLAQWEVAELIAAEASSAPGPFDDLWQREPWRGFAAGPPDSTNSNGHADADAAFDEAACRERDKAPSAAERNADGHGGFSVESDDDPSWPYGFEPYPASEPHSDSQDPDPVESLADVPRPYDESPESNDLDADATRLHDELTESNDLDAVVSPIEQELERLDELDAFELDAAMRRVRTAMQRRQARLGATLGLFLDLRLHDQLGYGCAGDYVRERLGLPERTARDLVRVAQAARNKSPALASAYEGGELSWLRVLALLSVARPWNVGAWITRASEVTLRRLNDEVAWALAQADADPRSAAAMPPAVGSDLGVRNDDRRMCAHGAPSEATATTAHIGDPITAPLDDDDRQMCAHAAPGDETAARSRDEFWGVIGRIRITFLAPVSTSVFFRTIMQGFATPTEPRWLAIERMLERVVTQWRSQPRHRDPVFARDGYRCTAPGCSSFANLHDHHIVPRSAGGTNELGNRTTLCAWHHLRAVHGGLATATGQAPDAIDWELGLSDEQAPLLRTRGDRYARTSPP